MKPEMGDWDLKLIGKVFPESTDQVNSTAIFP